MMNHLGLKQTAYNIIKEKIINLEFKPGSRIREDILADEVSMSRTPVREAVSQLSAEGWIRVIPRKGLFCIDLSLDQIDGLLDIRLNLEKLALAKCIENIETADLMTIKKNIEKYRCALNEKKYEKCDELDSEFHISMAQASKNKKLLQFILEIEELMRIVRNMEKNNGGLERRFEALKQHETICGCIEKKNVEGAVIELEKNIREIKKYI